MQLLMVLLQSAEYNRSGTKKLLSWYFFFLRLQIPGKVVTTLPLEHLPLFTGNLTIRRGRAFRWGCSNPFPGRIDWKPGSSVTPYRILKNEKSCFQNPYDAFTVICMIGESCGCQLCRVLITFFSIFSDSLRWEKKKN